MDIDDDDDDFYAPEEAVAAPATAPVNPSDAAVPAEAAVQDKGLDYGSDAIEDGASGEDNGGAMEEDDEGGEDGEDGGDDGEDDDDDDSDIDIIMERKDGTKAAAPSDIRNIPQRSTTSETVAKPAVATSRDTGAAPSKAVPPAGKPAQLGTPSADYPAVSTSNIDINAIPIHKATGKPITQVNIDTELPDNDKPWRKPGTDLSDYFNYGFDEFTWALYSQKQESLRSEYNQDVVVNSNKRMMEDFNMMMMGGMSGMPGMPGPGGMPGMPGVGVPGVGVLGGDVGMGGGPGGLGNANSNAVGGAGNNSSANTVSGPGNGAGNAGIGAAAPGAANGGVQGMMGMDGGMPPEMQQMLQQMMASGMDPSQMDPATLAAMMAQMSGVVPGGGHGGGGYGNQGFGGNQGYGGYDQSMGGVGRGNFGRVQGGRRNW